MAYNGLIAALGNPGPKYALTRHNVGFMVADAILAEIESRHYRKSTRLPSPEDFELWAVTLPRARGEYLLAKPMTYMNLSGRAVSRICRENGVGADKLLVIHDELDLPLGRIKLKFAGGTAGHNGLASIVEELGSERFARMRIGIGRPAHASQVRDWVLTDFDADEHEVLPEVLAKARDGVGVFFARGIGAAQQDLHAFSALRPGTEAADGAESGN